MGSSCRFACKCDGMLMVPIRHIWCETDTVRAWDYAVELQMPRMAFINKMDVDGADFFWYY